jgi:hypothetical protein
VATSLNNLAQLLKAANRLTEAEPLMRRALAILKKVLGPEHPNVATSLNNLATLYDNQGQYAKAHLSGEPGRLPPACSRILRVHFHFWNTLHLQMRVCGILTFLGVLRNNRFIESDLIDPDRFIILSRHR